MSNEGGGSRNLPQRNERKWRFLCYSKRGLKNGQRGPSYMEGLQTENEMKKNKNKNKTIDGSWDGYITVGKIRKKNIEAAKYMYLAQPHRGKCNSSQEMGKKALTHVGWVRESWCGDRACVCVWVGPSPCTHWEPPRFSPQRQKSRRPCVCHWFLRRLAIQLPNEGSRNRLLLFLLSS